MSSLPLFTSFDGMRRIAAGDLATNALAVKRTLDAGTDGPLLTFDDATGHPVDIDTRGDQAQVLARFAATAPAVPAELPAAEPRGRGRPKLGVVAREVTLLPRHWAWLETQPGGASITLRKLVEEARRADAGPQRRRAARERAYRVMHALAGNLAGFEEASRALFADDADALVRQAAAWPQDVRDYVLRLASDIGEQDHDR
jgi:hypothetical protein